jgi:hypothetical protein
MQFLVTRYEDLNSEHTFNITRSMILKQLDNTLVKIFINEDAFYEELDLDDENLINDPILNQDFQKEMKKYNNQLDKNPNMKKV